MKREMGGLTSGVVPDEIAGRVELALEQLQTNDGVDDDQEDDE